MLKEKEVPIAINSPALREAAEGRAIPLDTPWLMYTMPEGEGAPISAADDGTPLEGGPRKLEAGWYVCEIVLAAVEHDGIWVVEGERIYRVRLIADEAVQRVVLDNPNWRDV